MPSQREYRQLRFVPPPGATHITLVRHGESAPARDGDPFPLLAGQGDPELHPDGREQARRVAERLAREPVEAIYVTTLRRTAETAAPLAERLGLTPVVEPDLREVHLGEWEGGSFRRNILERHPIAVRMQQEQRWDVIPGAEPAEAFEARVRNAVGRIAARHPDGRVVAFTHGGTIGQVIALATDSRPFAFTGSDNASISRLVVLGDTWTLRSYNDTAHLDGEG